MSAKFTPGPWTPGWDVGRHRRLDCIACVEHHIFDAVDIYAPQAPTTLAEHEANVRLIAATPEMYDLLARLRENTSAADVDAAFDQLQGDARTLLARIDGEQV